MEPHKCLLHAMNTQKKSVLKNGCREKRSESRRDFIEIPSHIHTHTHTIHQR